MNAESGVVIPRHQPFYHVTVQDFLLLQCVKKPGTETYSNRGRGTAFQLMKTVFTNKPWKHKRMNMGMEVKQAAMGLQAEDPASHAGAELQAFTKVFLPLPALEVIVNRACGCTQVGAKQFGEGVVRCRYSVDTRFQDLFTKKK